MPVLPIALDPGWHLGGLTTVALALLGLCMVAGAFVLARPGGLVVPASVLYVVIGVVLAGALALLDVTPLDPDRDALLLERLCELALIVAVFSAGLTIERHVERRSWLSIAVLLYVVMPASGAGQLKPRPPGVSTQLEALSGRAEPYSANARGRPVVPRHHAGAAHRRLPDP